MKSRLLLSKLTKASQSDLDFRQFSGEADLVNNKPPQHKKLGCEHT